MYRMYALRALHERREEGEGREEEGEREEGATTCKKARQVHCHVVPLLVEVEAAFSLSDRVTLHLHRYIYIF